MNKTTLLVISTLCVVSSLLTSCATESSEMATDFENTLQNVRWNYQLASMITSNRFDLVAEFVSIRVAVDVADLWRWRQERGIAAHHLEEAEEYFVDAKPIVLQTITNTHFFKMPKSHRDAVTEYLRGTGSTTNTTK